MQKQSAPSRKPVSDQPWPDMLAEYDGPRLSILAETCPSWKHSEGLNAMLGSGYHPVSNPNGAINLGLAENLLLAPTYLESFKKTFVDSLAPIDLGYGDSLSGSKALQTSLVDLFNDYFAPQTPIQLGDLVVGNGVSTILDVLTACIVNPGEGIMVAAPYYPGFNACLVQRARARIVPVTFDDVEQSLGVESLERFEEVLIASVAAGIVVRAIMLVNPHNPTGRTYSAETLTAYAQFAEKHDLHLISNEIYALSTFANPRLPEANPFVSLLSLALDDMSLRVDRSRIHVVYGLSKDFGWNGLRIGCCVSPWNKAVLRAMIHQAFLMKVSTPADLLATSLLSNKEMRDRVIAKNRSSLAEAAMFISDWCREQGLMVVEGNSGVFILVSFRDRLGISTDQQEQEWMRCLARHGVLLSAGASYLHPQPGWVRITFAVERATLEAGLERVEKAMRSYPNSK